MAVCAEVKEHPILFAGEMVRAILDRRKTQTRRVISKRNSDHGGLWDRLEFDDAKLPPGAMPILVDNGYLHVPFRPHPEDCQDGNWWMRTRVFPTWVPGDRLWVRETWRETFDMSNQAVMEYRAGGTRIIEGNSVRHGLHRPTSIMPKWRPSIFMPRWASRITLEITEVRVQRLQEIDELDALDEGPPFKTITGVIKEAGRPERRGEFVDESAVDAFHRLWDSINSDRGYGWETNPLVWAITFKRCL